MAQHLLAAADRFQLIRLRCICEQRLCETLHYRYARDLGQLGPLQAQVVERGEARFLVEQQRRGVRLGDIKPSGFDPRPGWGHVFASGS